MPDQKISTLPENTSPTGSVEIELNNSGISQRVSLTNLLVETVTAYQAADNANSSSIITLQTDKANIVSPTFTGTVTVPTPINATDAVTKTYVDTADLLRVRLSGADLMTGNFNLNTNKIINLGTPTLDTDGSTKVYVDTARNISASQVQNYDPTITGAYPLDWTSNEPLTYTLRKGHRFRISVAGTLNDGLGSIITVQVGDILELIINVPIDYSSWTITQVNNIQATTTVSGNLETATDAEAQAKSSILVALTPSNLATGNFQASSSFEGLIELATQAETDAEIDATRGITSLTLANKVQTDFKQFVGLGSVINYSAGTWTTTRIVAGNYVTRKTAAANTTIIGIDITSKLRTAASKGFKLNSFDVLYTITTDDLIGHLITLYQIVYTDELAVSVSSIPITGTLITVVNANPRLTNISVTTPSFFSGDKYIIELSVQAAATSAYDFMGLILHYTKTL